MSVKSPVTVFTLPTGFRPAPGVFQGFAAGESQVLIAGTETSLERMIFNGNILGQEGKAALLSGITFRAGS